jgi:MATE family multidrug resistance protein
MAWQGAVGLAYVLAPGALLAWFAPHGDAGALVRVGAGMLMVSGLWQAFDALALTFGEALRAAGDTTWCMWARLVTAWLVFTPVAYVVVTLRGGGPIGAVASIVVYIVALAALFVWRFRSGAWRRIRLTEHDPVAA